MRIKRQIEVYDSCAASRVWVFKRAALEIHLRGVYFTNFNFAFQVSDSYKYWYGTSTEDFLFKKKNQKIAQVVHCCSC